MGREVFGRHAADTNYCQRPWERHLGLIVQPRRLGGLGQNRWMYNRIVFRRRFHNQSRNRTIVEALCV